MRSLVLPKRVAVPAAADDAADAAAGAADAAGARVRTSERLQCSMRAPSISMDNA